MSKIKMNKFFENSLNLIKKILPHLFRKKPKGTNCKIVLGLPGSGKSLYQIMEDILPRILNNEEIWSNTWLNIKSDKIHYFWKFEEVENLRNTTIFIDELGQFLPARDWVNEGLRVQMWFQLHRHRHLDIVANTQHVSLVAKTVGIVANSWEYLVKGGNVIMNFLHWLRGNENVAFDIYNLSWQKLKKIEAGMEIGDFSDDQLAGLHSTKRYFIEDIVRTDLDDLKIETIKKYCPECCIRTDEMIPKEKNEEIADYDENKGIWKLKEKEHCVKCGTELILKESGVYDTDYEPEYDDQDNKIFWQPMIPSPEGYTKIKYTGRLSRNKLDELEKIKNN